MLNGGQGSTRSRGEPELRVSALSEHFTTRPLERALHRCSEHPRISTPPRSGTEQPRDATKSRLVVGVRQHLLQLVEGSPCHWSDARADWILRLAIGCAAKDLVHQHPMNCDDRGGRQAARQAVPLRPARKGRSKRTFTFLKDLPEPAA